MRFIFLPPVGNLAQHPNMNSQRLCRPSACYKVWN